MARYRRSDTGRNEAVSTEITGYAAGAFVYLHSLTHDKRFLERAAAAAEFLLRAWDPGAQAMPFELDPPKFAYFFDCGIIIRGLLAAWRASGREEFRVAATAIGDSMARDFAAADGGFHPVLQLPGKEPVERDPARWSRSPGCYQLKSAMAWRDLADAGAGEHYRDFYNASVEMSLRDYARFLPGHRDREKVMDRLHAFLYFLEGLLPSAADKRCAGALCDGIGRTASCLREIAPEFARSDVYAQLLRIRIYAAHLGAAPLDNAAAAEEAAALETFQSADGCFYFGRKRGEPMPFDNPVSTAFALQALALWEGCAAPHRHLLI